MITYKDATWYYVREDYNTNKERYEPCIVPVTVAKATKNMVYIRDPKDRTLQATRRTKYFQTKLEAVNYYALSKEEKLADLNIQRAELQGVLEDARQLAVEIVRQENS